MPLLGNQEPLETKCGDCGLGRSFLACLRMTHPFVLSLVTFSARQLAAPDLLRTCHLSPSGCLLSVPVASSAQLAVCPLSLPTASSRPPPPPQEVTGASSRGGAGHRCGQRWQASSSFTAVAGAAACFAVPWVWAPAGFSSGLLGLLQEAIMHREHRYSSKVVDPLGGPRQLPARGLSLEAVALLCLEVVMFTRLDHAVARVSDEMLFLGVMETILWVGWVKSSSLRVALANPQGLEWTQWWMREG